MRGILKRDRRSVDVGAVARRLSDRGRAEHGFTLIEVLVSALLVLIISAGVAAALISSTDYTSRERNTSQANAVAQQDQERLKAMSDSQLTALHQTRTVTLNSTQFTVVSTASFLDANGNSTCTSKSQAYFKLTSTVTAPATPGNAAQSVTEETVITRPLAGSLVVPVADQTSAPLSGAAVSIVGQNTGYSSSATTDEHGCVAFAGLPTDGYTVTATDTGYVNPDGNPSPSETASVTQTSVASANTLVLGPAASQKVGFVTRGTSVMYDGNTSLSGHGPAPVGYELSYYGSGSGSNMTNPGCLGYPAKCSGSGSPVTYNASTAVSTFVPGNLFPFYLGSSSQYTNNYQLWAGSCEQEQPLQPPSGTDFATVTPGEGASSTSLDGVVQEPALDVAVKYNGSAAVSPAHVSITFTGKNAAGTTTTCVDTWHQVAQVGTETVSGTNYGIYPAPFASTAAKGSPTASNTGDPGTIQVCADYNGYKATSAALTVTNFNAPTAVPVVDVKTQGTLGTCP